jgi:hypothetical protein
MRAFVLLVVFGRVAGASPIATRCFAGDHGVIEQELDRDKHEIREHHWRDPLNESVLTFHVAADNKTFTFERGTTLVATGTLEGPLWKWTHIHREGSRENMKGVSDERIAGNILTIHSRTEIAGDRPSDTTSDAKAFDCKDLAKHIAALDDTAPDAKHACYAGSDTDGRHVVVDQITEAKRVQILTTTATGTGKIVMSIEGARIFVKNPGHSWTATGTITGKPGAWTGFEYTATIDKVDVRSAGTLGGPHFTDKTTVQMNGVTSTGTIDADAFDCKDLAAKRAALK